MNLNQFREFLLKFNINKKIIDEYLTNKKIIEINKNFFLVDEEFKPNEVFNDNLIFIQLKLKLPSKKVLNFINENSKNKLEIKNEKQAIEFTYSKSLSFKSIINKYQIKLKENEYYLILYENSVLGYFNYNPQNKTHSLKNLMNIGEYLHE